ncbi:MAG: hypothetical protein QOE01_3433 [Actinomycetota bacterium]|jgi:hypothetical protein|nr:hypothetical protein [Actinomycetota bacterium]
MVNAQPADCPFWCYGEHPTVADGEGFEDIVHELPVVRLRFDQEDGEDLAGKEIEISIQQWQDPDLPGLTINLPERIETLTESSARGIGEALVMAADAVRAIREAEDAVRTMRAER